jgi:RNA-binding protein 26
VKLYWHRPLDGKGGVGSNALAASAPKVSIINSQSSTSAAGPTSSSGDRAALAAKQQLLERQIAEQKVLMARLEKASTPEQKKEIMARLRQLNEEMKAPAGSPISPVPIPAAPTRAEADREKLEREKLDRELELHNAEGAVAESDVTMDGGEDEATKARREDLLARVAALRSEASAIGVSDDDVNSDSNSPTSSAQSYPTPRGFIRGRGRPRGFRAPRGGVGRGATPRINMTLDNRPKKLIVNGVRTEDEAEMFTVQRWFEGVGGMTSFNRLEGGQIEVEYKMRHQAEKALTISKNMELGRPIEITWGVNSGKPNAALGSSPASIAGPEEDATSLTGGELPGESSEVNERTAELEDAGAWGNGAFDE